LHTDLPDKDAPGQAAQGTTCSPPFGKPARVYHDGQYAIYVWNKNLLTDIPWVQPVNLP
jgi:hypothetical protein